MPRYVYEEELQDEREARESDSRGHVRELARLRVEHAAELAHVRAELAGELARLRVEHAREFDRLSESAEAGGAAGLEPELASAREENLARERARALVVTRHAALAAYLREIGAVGEDAEIIAHAGAEQIAGRVVAGPLPLHLAALAIEIVHVPLAVPPELRGAELTLEQVRALAGPVERYRVRKVST